MHGMNEFTPLDEPGRGSDDDSEGGRVGGGAGRRRQYRWKDSPAMPGICVNLYRPLLVSLSWCRVLPTCQPLETIVFDAKNSL